MQGKCKHDKNYSIIEEWLAHIDHRCKNGQFQKPYYGNMDTDDPSEIITFACDDCNYTRRFNVRGKVPKWFETIENKWREYLITPID